MKYLALLDADHIQDYVFATGRLKSIRGASLLVRNASEDSPYRHTAKNGIVFARGGSVIAKFDDPKDAQGFVDKVRCDFESRALGATITGVVQEWDDVSGNSFGSAVEQGGIALRLAKLVKDTRRYVEASYLKPCEWCREEAAVAPNVDGRPACAICRLKRAPATLRLSMSDAILGCLTNQDKTWQAAQPCQQLSELGKLAQPTGYLGFLYFDGNQVGRRLFNCVTDAEFSGLSSRLADATEQALIEALAQNLTPRRGLIPFQVVLVGGDDVTLIVPADKAMAVAATYLEEFQNRTKENGSTLTAAGGVVIAKDSFPIFRANDLGHQLECNAKRRAYAMHHDESCLDFVSITAAQHSSLSQAREVQYLDKDAGLQRTERPYKLSDMKTLLGLTGEFHSRGFPRNKLSELYHLCFHTRNEAQLQYLMLHQRLGQEHRALLTEFETKMGLNSTQLWRDPTPGYPFASTALPDLIELYDFVGR